MTPRDKEPPDLLNQLQNLVTEGIESGISTLSMQDILEAAQLLAAAVPPDGGL